MSVAAVVYLNQNLREQAESASKRLSVDLIDGSLLEHSKAKQLVAFLSATVGRSDGCLFLLLSSEGMSLGQVVGNGLVLIRADFHGPEVTYRRHKGGGRGQMIARAVGLRRGVCPYVLDATAGLGGDGFVLATLGCRVTLLERVPVIRLLLSAEIDQAKLHASKVGDAALTEALKRMTILGMDAARYLEVLKASERPDVVYLDPMFPSRSKSAMVKKEMQVFHRLVGQDEDAGLLLEAALNAARYRVVVKRPRYAGYLAESVPSHQLEGKSNRYDIYTKAKLPDGLNTL